MHFVSHKEENLTEIELNWRLLKFNSMWLSLKGEIFFLSYLDFQFKINVFVGKRRKNGKIYARSFLCEVRYIGKKVLTSTNQ